MVIAISILLLAAGALLWALDLGVSGLEASTIGVILIALGGVGLLGTLLASLAHDRITAVEVEETAEDDASPLPRQRRPPSR
jgi:hypothetical protein